MTVWSPGNRKNQLALETPFDGVPGHLRNPLWSWLESILIPRPGFIRDVGLELRVPLRTPNTSQGIHSAMQQLNGLCNDPAFFLDLVEYMLERRDEYSSTKPHELGLVLTRANSAYKVREDRAGLEMRVTPEVQQQVQEVVDSAGTAGTHLAAAWNAAYSRTPDPVRSYSESVKAVETALRDKISPNDGKATFGKMITALRDKSTKWKFVIPDGEDSRGVETVLGMMLVLWQRNARHGGPDHQPETLEEAQAAVHIAATLVQFGVSGAFDLA